MSDIHEHVADLVDDYLHALLSPGRAAEVERHCAACSACQAALEDARRRRALLQAVPPTEAPSHLITTTLQRISEHDRQRRRRLTRFFVGSLAALAACALVILGVQLYYSRLRPTPYDLLVLGQHNLLAATNSSLRIRLIDHTTKSALAGVPVVVELRGNGRSAVLARFTTDAQGIGQPRFQMPDWPDGEYGLIVTAQTPGAAEVISRSVRLTRSAKLMLTSDKPVYQPGQTIHVRALALRQPDLKPVAEQAAIFTLTDPKGNVLFKHTSRTSRYGIAAADCELARGVLQGAYTLACKVGDTESRQRIDVKKYVLPKFKVDVQTDRTFYQPKETAHLTVQTDYFFGRPVADAAVEIEVRTSAAPAEVIQRFTVRTDDKGNAKIEYTIPDQPPGSGDMRLSFIAAVTDSAGQKQMRGIERIVTRQPVRIEVLPENGKLVSGLRNVVYFLATHADGTPARVRLQIGGLNAIVNTDANGLATCEVTPSRGGVRWTLVAWDAGEKEVVHRNVDVPCGPAHHDFLLRTDRAVYESGQTMTLEVNSDSGESVFVDFIKDDQTLLSRTIEMDQRHTAPLDELHREPLPPPGHGFLAVDLPLDLFGTVRLCAYRLDANGVLQSKTRLVYVRPAGQLKITPKLDQAEYRPGRRARLDLTLTGADGKPCPGAISLAGVDEAVFAVLPQRPGMEEAYFTLDPQLLPAATNLSLASSNRKEDTARLNWALTLTAARGSLDNPAGFLHSLKANSLPAKVAEIERERAASQNGIKLSWLVLVLAAVGLGYIALWCCLRPMTVILLHFAALLTVPPAIGLMVTAVVMEGKHGFTAVGARNAAAPAQEADLTNVDLGMDETQLNLNVDRIEDVSVPGAVGSKAAAPRVRKAFPETLLWKPELITDDEGRAHLNLDLADSITTWRLSASAVAADGRLGATQLPLKVFQPFFVDLNLPVSLTRNDEVSVPVVVYNYLDKPQTVTLALKSASWFALQGDAEQRLDLAPREVRSLTYRIKATKAGSHELQVSASAAGIADALKRSVEVAPDGRRIEHVFNGTLQQPGGATLDVPANAIDGSVQAFVKIYPSAFSQLVEGLDSIFQMPYGCFEQTSSTTYPNILALDYLRRHNQRSPRIETKARQYIHLGYQRLIGFEVPGGGFDWFGRAPANRTLTAYGLMEFEDMARVHEVDPQLIARTRRWLLAQRKSDGSWMPEGHALHEDVTRAGDAKLATTAYIAWAVFANAKGDADPAPTRIFLLGHAPDSIRDPHVLALVCSALLALDPQGESATPYLDRLEALKRTSDDGKQVWWQQPQGARTTFYGTGRSGEIETTALATLALLHGKRHSGTSRGALAWLIAQKDPRGTWHSTQATVLTLKALLAADSASGDEERRILAEVGDKLKREIDIPADQGEVLKQLDLSSFLSAGRQRVQLTETTKTGSGYQVVFRYHVPEAKPDQAEPLTVNLAYDRTELRIGETIKATAKVANNRPENSAMVMLDLPVPAGFTVDTSDLAALVQTGRIARFQVQNRNVLVYLRELAPKTPLELTYHLRAAMAVKIGAPGARAYEYYNPEREGRSAGTQFTVTAPR